MGLNQGQLVFDGPPEQLTDVTLARIYQRTADEETVHESNGSPVRAPIIFLKSH